GDFDSVHQERALVLSRPLAPLALARLGALAVLLHVRLVAVDWDHLRADGSPLHELEGRMWGRLAAPSWVARISGIPSSCWGGRSVRWRPSCATVELRAAAQRWD